MIKIWLNTMICATMLLGGNMEHKDIHDYLISPSQVEIVVGGEYRELKDMDKLKGCHIMPAFGVSIHTETIKSLQQGVWLRLQYNGKKWVDGMDFDELLIEVQPDFSGFNIIRGNIGIYDGRCYYVDLSCNMKLLYNYINSVLIQEV